MFLGNPKRDETICFEADQGPTQTANWWALQVTYQSPCSLSHNHKNQSLLTYRVSKYNAGCWYHQEGKYEKQKRQEKT